MYFINDFSLFFQLMDNGLDMFDYFEFFKLTLQQQYSQYYIVSIPFKSYCILGSSESSELLIFIFVYRYEVSMKDKN